MKNIYVCGPTVYSNVHIGNIRPVLTFDIFIRSLKYLGDQVEFIHNITDIDDKIINRAIEENKTEKEISSFYLDKYKNILKQINVETITKMPLVTDNLQGIIDFISSLEKQGFAYGKNGTVYFDVSKLTNYGKVSNKKLDELIFEKEQDKNHPADFALWKKTQIGIVYQSPWGKGRPGWHTECSMLIDKYLNGESLDIHGGGIDLIFPHHENEQAQYFAKNSKDITKEWKHVGHILFNGEKMSKSLGNIWDAQEFIDKFGPDVLRMIFLKTNTTAPLDINEETINFAKETVEKWKKVYSYAQLITWEKSKINSIAFSIKEWNFSNAMKEIFEKIKAFNHEKSFENAKNINAIFELIGFTFSKEKVSEHDQELYKQWNLYREKKEFDQADKIRNYFLEKGIL